MERNIVNTGAKEDTQSVAALNRLLEDLWVFVCRRLSACYFTMT